MIFNQVYFNVDKKDFYNVGMNMTLHFMFMMLCRKSATMIIHFVPLIMLSPRYIYVWVLCVSNTIYIIY
jgi:hypothetical protein